jgi:hypothetical protein
LIIKKLGQAKRKRIIFMTRKRSLMERLGLAITGGKSDAELAVTDDQPADDAWSDVEDEPEDDPWLGTDDEPVDDADPVQATDGDPDAVVQSDVTSNQPILPLGAIGWRSARRIRQSAG